MAQQYDLNEVAVQMFRDEFIEALQQSEHKLAGSYREVHGVVGDAYKWPITGAVDMQKRIGGPLSQLPNTNVDYSRVTTTFDEYFLKLESDATFTQSEVNVNEVQQFAKDHSMAIERRQDQEIIGALDAASTTNTIAAGGANMTFAKLREANQLALKNNWPDPGRVTWHMAIGDSQVSSLYNEEKVTSSDYSTMKVLQNGSLSSYMGFEFHIFGDSSITNGGLPLSGNNRTCFAWYTRAVGLVYSVDPMVRVFPLNSDLVVPTVSSMKLGADVLLSGGIIKITCDESA